MVASEHELPALGAHCYNLYVLIWIPDTKLEVWVQLHWLIQLKQMKWWSKQVVECGLVVSGEWKL